MPVLPEKPTLSDLQKYIAEYGIVRGWNKNNVLEIFLLFTEEVGELAKAIRNKLNLYAEQGKKYSPEMLEDEFADVLNYLLDLANVTEVDLEQAFRKKDEKNAQRIWKEKP